jgi:hypothetical protein
VNNLWQVRCQWGHQIGTETSFLCFHPSRCHRLDGVSFPVTAVSLSNVKRSARGLAWHVVSVIWLIRGAPRYLAPLPLYVMVVGIPASWVWVPGSNIRSDTYYVYLLYPRLKGPIDCKLNHSVCVKKTCT